MTNYELITLIFSGTVCLSTVVYSILTYSLVKESKLTREYYNTPDIHVYFQRAEADASFIFIVFQNIGLGHAKNVKIKIEKNFNFYRDELFNLTTKGIIKNGKENFHPGQKFEYFFTDLYEEYENKINDNISFVITYENLYSKKFTKYLNLELSELLGESILNPPPHYLGRIAHELKEIKGIIKKTRL